ncbi:shikimate kinase [Hominifimenecus sp. rT4P-3]|uniref:shikimate kinase n=1 Tax=Hominifimenecus sp. rT4P-3 TaxID=3242979 RepID=UPI003DA62F42
MDNIILIGMPGCGKSTVGVVLAKHLGFGFIDSDLLIQEREKRRLCEIIDQEGLVRFNRIEEEVNAAIRAEHSVIATGGSVVYGPQAMEHFRQIGTVVYLKLTYEEIEERLGDLAERGVSVRPGQSLRELYGERVPLYERYAHVTVDGTGLSLREVVLKIKAACGK